ncbi:MAG: hypothetical protein H0U52_00450 [Chloroflexi bacterium]|nr:hypothetical protein [Chloroflexota bacterium]
MATTNRVGSSRVGDPVGDGLAAVLDTGSGEAVTADGATEALVVAGAAGLWPTPLVSGAEPS